MMRIRVDGGRLSGEQLRAIAWASERFGRDVADITDRQNVQLHWIRIEDIPAIWERLEAAGYHTGSVRRHPAGHHGVPARRRDRRRAPRWLARHPRPRGTDTSLISGFVHCTVHPLIEVLYLRGRLENAGSPSIRSATARMSSEPSRSSSAVTPASGHPMMTRGVSPHASCVDSPTASSRSQMAGTSSIRNPVQLHVLPVGDVRHVAPEPLRCPRDRAELLAAQPSAVHPDPHHEELVLELLRLGAPRALTGNALLPLRVEAPPTQPRPQVLLPDRPESARSEDPLDAFADGEPVVLLLDLLRGVERLVVAQPPLTLAARARGPDGPVGGFVHGFRVVDRGRERRGPPVRAARGAAGGSCGLPHAMARARGARAARTAAETGRDHGGDLSDGSCADHGSLSGRPFASGSPRSAPAAHGGSLVAGAKPYLSGRKDVKERGHRCACVPPRSAPGAGGGRRRGR